MDLQKMTFIFAAATLAAGCGGSDSDAQAPQATATDSFVATPMAQFSEPWAMTFLPDTRLLVTEKRGTLKIYTINGTSADITGTPAVSCG